MSQEKHNKKVKAITAALKELGWRQNSEEGFLFKTSRVKKKGTNLWGKRRMRVKLQENSCRIDVLIPTKATGLRPASLEWVRIAGGYWKDCDVLPDGRVKLGTILLGQQKEKPTPL